MLSSKIDVQREAVLLCLMHKPKLFGSTLTNFPTVWNPWRGCFLVTVDFFPV